MRSVYLTVYSEFTEVVQTSWYGAYMNCLCGRNPVNVVLAALSVAFISYSGMSMPSI